MSDEIYNTVIKRDGTMKLSESVTITLTRQMIDQIKAAGFPAEFRLRKDGEMSMFKSVASGTRVNILGVEQ